MKLRLVLLFFVLLFAKCSNQQESTNGALDNNLYKYLDLKSTTKISQDNKSYIKLDSLQKRQILPDITKGLNMDKDFPYSSLFSAYFVAKQKKIGNAETVILKLEADDFDKVILITLNETNSPIDYLDIDDEEYCGGGHLLYCEKVRHSILNNNEIITYDLFKTESSQNDLTSYTDSIVFKSIIKPGGRIETTKMDSIRINNK
jgi:hypothetical protein